MNNDIEKLIAELEEVKLCMEAFFDPEGNPPEDTGEFRELKGAIKMIEYVIRSLDDITPAASAPKSEDALTIWLSAREKECRQDAYAGNYTQGKADAFNEVSRKLPAFFPAPSTPEREPLCLECMRIAVNRIDPFEIPDNEVKILDKARAYLESFPDATTGKEGAV